MMHLFMNKRSTYQIANWHHQRIKCRSFSEAVVWRCSVKIVFLKFLQVSQESTCVRVSYNKFAWQGLATLSETDLSTDFFM